MNFNFDKIIHRENSNSVKYDLRETFFKKRDVIPLWVADMDFETPIFIREAIKKRAEHPIYGYSIKPETYSEAIISWLEKRHHWAVKIAEIGFSPGVVPGFTLAILAYSLPGDQIVVQPPVYFPFFDAVKDTGRKLLNNQLLEKDNYYKIDFKDLEEKLRQEKTRLLLISSPHNPVGRVWSEAELNKMVEMCIKHNVLLLSDEIHADLVFNKHKHIPAALTAEHAKDSIITFMAPSKTFNLAGLSTSFLIIQNEYLKEKYESVLNTYHLRQGNIFGNEALEAAYNYGSDWLDQLIVYLQSNINFVSDFLEKEIPQISFQKPEATYLLWLNCKSLNMNDDELNNFFINDAGLGLNMGSSFGPGGSGYMRMNVACPHIQLETALKKLKQALEKKGF
jgi:cystathionine beta-lyase